MTDSGVRIAFLGPGLSLTGGHPVPVSVLADIPLSYSHYYSNPSYHTLSQCSPNPPPPNKVSAGEGALGRDGKHLLSGKLHPCSSRVRFPAISSSPASRPLSGQVGPMGLTTTPRCLRTGSTWPGVGA